MSTSGELPIGTVTFLFTDIEGSTQLLKQLGGERYGESLADHQRILREAFAEHGGHEIDTQGDSFFVAFRRAKDAVSAAIACQRRLAEHAWPAGTDLRVRMGIHTGEPAAAGERYVGLGVHRAARICAAGHGGQVLLSQTARELLRDDPIADVSLRDLGEHQLKDLDEPERLYQLVAPGLLEDFPALKSAAPAPFEGREGELAEAAAEEMARRWRRPGRRVLIGATFAAALVGVALGVLLTQGGGSTAGASVGPNAVGLVDAESGKVAAEIAVGVAPGAVAASADAIWVTNTGGNSVSRIDPQTNDVRQTVPVGGAPAGIAVSPNAVWVANGLAGTVSRIDARTSQVSQTVTVGNGPSGVAYGEGAVWVTNSTDGTVARIDPASGRVTKTFPVVTGASAVAVGFRRVWVVSPPAGSLVVVDPGSGQVLKRIAVGVDPSAVATGAGAIWVANRADGTVSMIDPNTQTVRNLIQVGRTPTGIAVGPSDVWVTNAGDGTLSRFDPSNPSKVASISLHNPPSGIVLTGRGAYVAVGSAGLEHRGGNLEVLSGEVESIDPGSPNYSATAGQIFLMTNDGLVAFRKLGGVEGAQLVPDLAVSLPSPTDGGKTYTFQLRPGIHYSNGALVQPDDFRRALERSIEADPGVATIYRIVGGDRCVKGKPCDLSHGIVADRAARTITFRLAAPDADFLAKLAQPQAFAVPTGTPVRDVGSRPVPATGPYRIARFDKKARTVRLVRNPEFREWSADAQPQGYPSIITVRWLRESDGAARVRRVEGGASDVALGGFPPLSKDQLERLAVSYPSQLHVNPLLAMSEFFFNTRLAPFDDVRVRRAVNEAFDREAFARQLGPAVAPTCRILPRNFPGYQPVCPFRSGGLTGLELGRRLVRSSGTGGAEVTVWVFGGVADQGRYMVSLLASLGYRAHLKVVNDIGAYFTAVRDSRVPVQIGFNTWFSNYPSAASWLPVSWSCASFVPASPQENQNMSRFCDRSIDAQMTHAEAVQAQDPAAATVLWQQAEDSLLAQAPDVPVYTPSIVDFVSKRVGNYQYNPSFGVLLDQLWVK